MKKFLVMIVAVGLCLPLVAQEKKAKTPEEQFAAMDKNGDKKLSKEEYLGNSEGEKRTKKEDRFKNLDKNSDNYLSLEEFQAGVKKKAN
jgi:Ca2+-binding EF-hand superfamily protein